MISWLGMLLVSLTAFIILQLGRLFQMLEGLGTKVEKDGLLDKYRKSEFNLINTDGWSMLTKKFLKALPYSLTPSQLRAASEIIWDLKQPVPMNRLLQVVRCALLFTCKLFFGVGRGNYFWFSFISSNITFFILITLFIILGIHSF